MGCVPWVRTRAGTLTHGMQAVGLQLDPFPFAYETLVRYLIQTISTAYLLPTGVRGHQLRTYSLAGGR